MNSLLHIKKKCILYIFHKRWAHIMAIFDGQQFAVQAKTENYFATFPKAFLFVYCSGRQLQHFFKKLINVYITSNSSEWPCSLRSRILIQCGDCKQAGRGILTVKKKKKKRSQTRIQKSWSVGDWWTSPCLKSKRLMHQLRAK